MEAVEAASRDEVKEKVAALDIVGDLKDRLDTLHGQIDLLASAIGPALRSSLEKGEDAVATPSRHEPLESDLRSLLVSRLERVNEAIDRLETIRGLVDL